MPRNPSRLANGISEGSKRISKLLKASVGIPDPGQQDGPEEDHWVVGGRYQVLQQATLHARPDLASDKLGQIRPKDNVLLLALQNVQTSSGEVLLAYVANTKKPEWVAGWGQIEGIASKNGALHTPVLRRRRLQGSWEVGGRYIVMGSPVLRTSIEMESEQISEILAMEEVLVLDLGLVIRSGEPRLRSRVRTDSGSLGWLTVELPGGSPLLEPLNLYSAEALQRRSNVFGNRSQLGGTPRVTLSGKSEGIDEAWEVGGKYRCLDRLEVTKDADPSSSAMGELRRGTLVLVTEIHPSWASEFRRVRLKVEIATNDEESVVGWLSPDSADGGEKLLDFRDHLEFEKLMRMQLDAPQYQDGRTASPSNMLEAETTDTRRQLSAPRRFSCLARGLKNGEVARLMGELEARNAITQTSAALPEVENGKQNGLTRPWSDPKSGYRTLRELDEEKEDRQVGDNLENENCGGVCCRSLPLFCGSRTAPGKVSRGGVPPHPLNHHGMMGEPAPEPRPARQMPPSPGSNPIRSY